MAYGGGADSLYGLGVAAIRAGDAAGGEALLRRALAAEPDRAESINALGIALQRQHRLDEAIACYRDAIDRKPDYAAAFANLGAALQTAGRMDEAVACYGDTLARWPDQIEARYNLGNALQAQGRSIDAETAYRDVLRRNPVHADALNNLGIVLRDLGRLDEALSTYRLALASRPGDAGFHYNHALALLEAGDSRGWAEHEWRFAAGVTPPPDYSRPAWLGEDPSRQIVLVWAEQGFGDTLQFVRLAPALTARGAKVVLEVQPELVRLLRGLPGIHAVVSRGDALPDFDCHVAMLSLPAVLGIDPVAVPPLPVLAAPGDLVAAWAGRLGPATRPRVGLVWAGNARQANDSNRSLPLDLAAALAGRADIEMVSLQVGPAAGALSASGLRDLSPDLTDFAETAAALTRLDLLVTVDTASAHLAGALGLPVWTMLCFAPDWRWQRGRSDSPWYPGMRLFRQPAPGDWRAVVDAVAADLDRLAAGDRSVLVGSPPMGGGS
jgi:Flp pilus assembly protein TadD